MSENPSSEDPIKVLRDPVLKRAAQLSPEEALEQRWKSVILSRDEPYRLEVVYDEDAGAVILQADQAGLVYLQSVIAALASSEDSQRYERHFDTTTMLTHESNVKFVIRRVESEISDV